MPLESQIPLPTDNIYKFYALFGLALFIFSLGAGIYETHATNELVFQTVVEQEALKQIQNPSPVDEARKLILQKRYDIGVTDSKVIRVLLIALAVGSFYLMIYGFWKWHKKVQPVQNEIAELQRDKLRLEVEQMKFASATPAKSNEQQERARTLRNRNHGETSL